jgi:hypothetical protein
MQNLTKTEKAQLIEKLSFEAIDCTLLPSITWGEPTEVWNLATCWIQDAEAEGNDLVAHVECALSFESNEIGAYFRSLGFNF